jgi:hypothetical protein
VSEALARRRRLAMIAYYSNGGTDNDPAGHVDGAEEAVKTATRVQVSKDVVDAGEAASGYGGDIGRDTYRKIITAAFRAAGFEVEGETTG